VNGSNRIGSGGPHPIVAVLREQGRSQTWLALKLGLSVWHTNRVLHGWKPASPAVRRACARLLGVGESELFHGHDSHAPPVREADARDGAAVRGGYPRPAGLSTLREAPRTESA